MAKTRHLLPKLEPTDPGVYFNRRSFMKSSAALGTIAGISSAHAFFGNDVDPLQVPISRPEVFPAKRNPKFDSDTRKPLTERTLAATHNNFYEFLPGRGGPVYKLVDQFKVDPWKVEVTGLCEKPRTFDLDDIFKFEQEERVYGFRCVETWAMNVPWTGFPLSKLLKAVQPLSGAKFVRLSTLNRPKEMPGIAQETGYPWPYHEALRMDEAMNELTLMATGIFGQPLLKQHGAPMRLVVPWKYGYKSPKSIVKIELLAQQPLTFWGRPPYTHEYGFLSNVNPNIPHPRWSQATSYFLTKGSHIRRGKSKPTELFNGYGDFVGKLYPDEPKTPQAPMRRGQTAR
jgi:methionine sulfoxide reductase catalytic subunit